MTQTEFYDRTGVVLPDDKFWEMHEDYCNSSLDKDAYCKQWLEAYNREEKYYYFRIVLQPQNKCVKDMALHCTEPRMREIAFGICNGLNEAGMSFNGKNAHHYFELETMEVPSPAQTQAIGL